MEKSSLTVKKSAYSYDTVGGLATIEATPINPYLC